jgi:hypothetical protein
MGMSSYVMDCEEKFMDEVSARIGQCETVGELGDILLKDGCFNLIPDHLHMEILDECWNEYWSAHAA